MQNPPLHKLYIHGGYVDCAQPECEQFAAINPATGEVIAHLQSACEEDINWAVESAKQGQKNMGCHACDGALPYSSTCRGYFT